MAVSEPLVLVGPMGAGKSSIGRRVARRLGETFFDTDTAVILDHGPIAKIFEREGEARFRELEHLAVRRGLETGGVIALGGGAVMDQRTRALLRYQRVVLLLVDEHTVASRIRGRKRPLLNGTQSPVEHWRQIVRERMPVYEEVADVTFDTSQGPLHDIVDQVVQWAHEHRSGHD